MELRQLFQQLACDTFKSALVQNRIEYGQLAEKLTQLGFNETAKSISSKINRGTFNYDFVLQCCYVLDMPLSIPLEHVKANIDKACADDEKN